MSDGWPTGYTPRSLEGSSHASRHHDVLIRSSLASLAGAQGQAINGAIEGTVTDESGAVLPGVTVTVTNVDTGETRSVITNDRGVYRAPLLPLGAYRVSAELQDFKKYDQAGVSLSAGQVAVINVKLAVGAVTETVSVSADVPVVDLGKIEEGRTLTTAEIKTLPLTSRNPYNFALLQPGVVGFETQEFGVPRLTANGALLRVNYQIDGNDNTEKDRAGLRQMPMSEVMIREVKVVTSGYAPEFGQTMGLVYNAITPSGSNRQQGQASYRFQRQPMVDMPFFATTAIKPPTKVNIFTADNGGAVVKDRTFYFAGVERTQRDLSGTRVVTITPANAARLGLSEPTYILPRRRRRSRSASSITTFRPITGSVPAISSSITSFLITSAALPRACRIRSSREPTSRIVSTPLLARSCRSGTRGS